MKIKITILLITILSIYGVFNYVRNSPVEHTAVEMIESKDFYTQNVQPIFDAKCIACHACYNSPCQLNLTSYTGTMRGGNKVSLYDFPKFKSRNPTRLFVDAVDENGWREKGFYKVYNTKDEKKSILNHMIFNLEGIESGKQDQYTSEESRECISDLSVSSLDNYKKINPAGRMPYGLPALDSQEIDIIKKWQILGAPGPDLISEENQILNLEDIKSEIKEWENFFNQNGLKAQLSSRYIYEHLFLANIYFEKYPKLSFRLVRSKTKIGIIDEIATVYPFDDPGGKFYYRLRPLISTIVHKSHLPFEFTQNKLNKWRDMFYSSRWDRIPNSMPPYGRAGGNPYLTFEDIPVIARYKFLLDEANYHIMTFIKGPVCRGQTALNVINDHFWVFFIDPSKDPLVNSRELYKDIAKQMLLPAELKDDLKPLVDLRDNYWAAVKSKFEYLEDQNLDLNWIWNGKKNNLNSSITVMRHFDSAHVMKGLQGRTPKTVWVLDYHVLESIYYNLTSGYNVFGPILHQVNSRLFMEISRISSEDLFLSFLPASTREDFRSKWNLETPKRKESAIKWLSDLLRGDAAYKMKYKYKYMGNNIKTSIDIPTKNAKEEFLNKLKKDVFTKDQITSKRKKLNPQLEKLGNIMSKGISFLPDSILVKFENEVYTLVHHKDHYNVSMLFFEDTRRNTENDTLDIIPGVVTSYPNAFILLNESKLKKFVSALEESRDSKDIWKILKDYSVSRSDADFWNHYNYFSSKTYEQTTNEFGYLDLNRYINI